MAGLLSGIRRQPLLCEGDLLARILTGDEVGEVAEAYLMGHGQSGPPGPAAPTSR